MEVAPNDDDGDEGEDKTDREARLHAGAQAESDDQPTTDWRSDDDGHTLKQRLNAEADAAAIMRQVIGDDSKDCRQRQVAPGHDGDRSDEKPHPTGTAEIDRIANSRNNGESDQRLAPAEPIADPAAGKGQDGFEQILECAIKGDNDHTAAEHFEIARRESRPELLADAEREQGDEQHDDIRFETQSRTQPRATAVGPADSGLASVDIRLNYSSLSICVSEN